jgi:predicted dehydrogenase
MDKETVPRVGIIGCGRIGSLWDEQVQSSFSKTHAQAFFKIHPKSLVAFCDVQLSRAQQAARHWSCQNATDSIDQFLKNTFDIISLCTPVESRFEIVKKNYRKTTECHFNN